MSTVSLPPIPSTLPPAIVGTFNIALTSAKFQQLADEESRLEYNEDNVADIKAFLDKTKTVTKAIEATHKTGKAEALEIGRAWDSAKNSFIAQVDAIASVPAKKYDELCRSIQKKAQEVEAERVRKLNIKNGIETNAVNFAKKISECTTSAQLTRIESTINLEKTRKEKYQEFLEEAVDRYSQLNSILKTQKETVKQLEQIEEEKLKAEQEGNDEKVLELQQKQEEAETKIEEKKIEVQEAAINQSINTVVEPEIIIPTVKARRSVWKWELVDIKETAKKMPDFVKMQTVDEKIDEYLKAKKAEGITGEEFNFAGIRFYLEKTF